MYHPYFRGKQYELITIRESAALLKASNFIPIIEPVKQSLGGLQKTIEAIKDVSGTAIVIVNPHHGDHAEDGKVISILLAEQCRDYPNISVGILLKENTKISEVEACCDEHREHKLALIHAGFGQGKQLAEALGHRSQAMQHVFFDERSGKLYQKHFQGTMRVLLRDGFQRRRGKDYPDVEFFSDLHATFKDEGMNAFGDFLMVGDDYTDSGGPAYTVAIHVTFINPERDDAMHIHHFKSIQQDTPVDPAGKFAEALDKLITTLDSPGNMIFQSQAMGEFRELHKRGHFPGLGHVKKLSMNHHIETLADYLATNR
jgi:hypothetical protein